MTGSSINVWRMAPGLRVLLPAAWVVWQVTVECRIPVGDAAQTPLVLYAAWRCTLKEGMGKLLSEPLICSWAANHRKQPISALRLQGCLAQNLFEDSLPTLRGRMPACYSSSVGSMQSRLKTAVCGGSMILS